MPYFSVIIPLYNKQNYIVKTLQSVLAQTFTDFEIIIINDVSTDNSVDIAKTIQDERIKLINHPVNKGLSASRNTGIKNAVARYIAFLDADDIWKPQFLETIAGLIQSYPEAKLFATKYEEIYRGNVVIEHTFNVGTGIITDFFDSNLNQSVYYPSCLCADKTVFDEIGYYNENITYGEDIDFNIRAHLAFTMAYCSRPLVEYNMQSENQITQSSIDNKTVTDFDSYEDGNPGNKALKKYLDFQRYVLAKKYRQSGNVKMYTKMLSRINKNNLNYKQRILLACPAPVLQLISKVKTLLHKAGLNPTSY